MVGLSLIVALCFTAHTGTHAKRTELSHVAIQPHDWKKAADFPEPWTDSEIFERDVKELMKRVEALKTAQENGEHASEEENRKLMETMYLIINQKLLAATNMQCVDFCAVCLPQPEEFENGEDIQLKSIFVDRHKGFTDLGKMMAGVGLLDSLAGAGGGVVKGLLMGLGSGLAVGVVGGVAVEQHMNEDYHEANKTATEEGKKKTPGYKKAPGHVLGALAGLAMGSVTSAAVIALSEIFMPVIGLLKGIGITGKVTQCSRVGFEASVNGQSDKDHSFPTQSGNPSSYGLKLLRTAMDYDKKWFDQGPVSPTENTIVAAQSESAQKAHDYNAVSHCEYLRLRNFDVRHVLECVKHSMLCGGQGALLLPANNAGVCQEKSDKVKLEEASTNGEDDGLSKVWFDAKKRKECIALLCKYKGFKKGSTQTHPDRVNNMDIAQAEKDARVEDFVKMNACTDSFKAADGTPLTLDSEEQRSDHC